MLMQQLLKFDVKFFFLINRGSSNAFFDVLMPLLRESTIWTPLYVFILLLVWQRFGTRTLLWLLAAIVTVAITDLVSSRLIKENVMRLRPCRNPEVVAYINFLVKYCPSSSSFTSSHATNHFGMAMFIFITLKNYFSPGWLALLFLWALSICYAQVYVGVHYPLDVLSGGLLGCLLGYTTGKLFNRRFRLSKVPGLG